MRARERVLLFSCNKLVLVCATYVVTTVDTDQQRVTFSENATAQLALVLTLKVLF